jgi:outer membrane autotransporter protein
MWGRLIYRDGTAKGDPLGFYGGSHDGPAYNSELIAFQIGMDVYRHVARDENGKEGDRDHIGIMGTYGGMDANVDHNLLGFSFPAGQVRMENWSLGAFWTHFEPNGAYLDVVGDATFYKAKLQSFSLPQSKTDGFGFALSAEGGYPFRVSEHWLLEPQAQLIYQWLSLDSFNDAAAHISFRDLDSLLGRIGLRFANVGPTQVWLRGNIWHEFIAKPTTEFSSADGLVPFRADPPATWWQIGLGGSVLLANHVTAFGQGSYESAFDRDSHSWTAKFGLRFNF